MGAPVFHCEGTKTLVCPSLAVGWLAGQYCRQRKRPKDSRLLQGDRWDNEPKQRASERAWRVIDETVCISEVRGIPASKPAVSYVRMRDWMNAPMRRMV